MADKVDTGEGYYVIGDVSKGFVRGEPLDLVCPNNQYSKAVPYLKDVATVLHEMGYDELGKQVQVYKLVPISRYDRADIEALLEEMSEGEELYEMLDKDEEDDDE